MSDITYTCEICSKSFKSHFSLNGHKRVHGNSQGKILNLIYCCEVISRKVISTKNLNSTHTLSKRQIDRSCPQCGKNMLGKSSKFCSRSCAATFNNLLYPKKKNGIKQKRCQWLDKNKLYPNHYKASEYPFSRIFYTTCKHCGKNKFAPKAFKYCDNCINFYKERRNLFKFTFNVFDYPDLFDLDHLKRVGFYAPGGKSGRWNLKGLSRDHKVSVAESLKNGYDPFYIKHPLNCELMPHHQNNRKKHNSSITYEELKFAVDSYEKKNGSKGPGRTDIPEINSFVLCH